MKKRVLTFDSILASVQDSARQFNLDAGETLFTARSLEYVYAETFDVEYADLKARQLFTVNTSIPSGASTHTYRQYDKTGTAARIHNYGEDFPAGDMFMKEFTGSIRGLGASWGYSVQDIRAAQLAGVPLDTMLAMNAREMIERSIEDIACNGDSLTNLYGLLTAPNVGSGAVASLAWDNTGGANYAAVVVADATAKLKTIFDSTFGKHKATQLLLPTSVFSAWTTTPYSPLYTRDTVMDYFKAMNPGVSVEHWPALDASKTAVALENNRRVVELLLPQDFEQMAPQARNMFYSVACHARTGGMAVRYPKAVYKITGAAT